MKLRERTESERDAFLAGYAAASHATGNGHVSRDTETSLDLYFEEWVKAGCPRPVIEKFANDEIWGLIA